MMSSSDWNPNKYDCIGLFLKKVSDGSLSELKTTNPKLYSLFNI